MSVAASQRPALLAVIPESPSCMHQRHCTVSCLPTEGSVNVLPNTRQHCMLQLKLSTENTDPNFDIRVNRDDGRVGGGEGGEESILNVTLSPSEIFCIKMGSNESQFNASLGRGGGGGRTV